MVGYCKSFDVLNFFAQIGIIGGSGLDDPDILEGRTERYVDTPYGKVSEFVGLSFCETNVNNIIIDSTVNLQMYYPALPKQPSDALILGKIKNVECVLLAR